MAQRLRVPLGTVMSRISRGRRLLHERLLALDGRGSGK
jgi:DNA-directed RNA polymerase specialized sigma24 family protein